MAELEFEDILPFVEGEGDTGRTAREKINRNFTKIKPIANVGAEMQQLRQDVADDLEQLHDDVEEMVDKTTSLFGYYICSTAGATAAKSVNATNYELTTGGNIRIKMEHANTAASPVTLQIGNAAAKELYYNGEAVSDENTWEDNEVIVVYYDGTSYYATNSLGGGGKKGDGDLSRFFNVAEEQVGGSANLIDPSKYVVGAVLSDGSVDNNGNYKTTDYIELEEGETYTFFVNVGSEARPSNPNLVCYYGASKEVVSYISTGLTSQLTVPTGAQYARLTKAVGAIANPTLTGLIKGANLTISDFVEYEPVQSVEYLELNDGGKAIDKKTNDEIVTKKNLVDYVQEQMGDMPDISALEELVAGIKQKTDLLTVVEEQVGGSANLIDPSKYIVGAVLSDGSVDHNGNYKTTDYIELEEGETYTFFVNVGSEARPSNPNLVCYYGASKEVVSYISTGLTSQLTVPTGAQYARLTKAVGAIANPTLTGLIKGANLTISDFVEYEPKELRTSLLYDVQTPFADKNESEVITKKDIPTDGGGSDEGLGKSLLLNFKKGTGVNHDVITITDGSNNIKCSFDKWDKDQYYRGNHIFNFLSMLYNGKTSNDTDDVPALHAGSGTYLGGNHTTPGQLLTAAAHGLTNSNLGIKFTTSNSQEYTVMRVIDGDRFVVLPNSPAVPTGNATINGRQVNITAKSSYEMFPSQFSQTQKINIDGKELAIQDSDVVANADVVDIVDAYNIVDFGFVDDISMQVTGQSSDRKLYNIIVDNIAYSEAPVRARIENIYRFMTGLKALVITNVIFLQDTYFIELGLSMAVPKVVNSDIGSSTYPQNWRMYIPGSTEVSSTKVSSTGDSLTNSINFAEPTIFIPPAGEYWTYDVNGWADQNKPVNRVIGISKDNVGFALGYIPVGAGANLTNYTTKSFEISHAGKIYPRTANRAGLQASGIMTGFNIPSGTVISGVMYRIPFNAANQSTGRICLYDVDYEGYKYVFIDYNQTLFDYVELDDSLNGHTIELVEQRNAVLKSSVYNGGFYVDATHISGDSSYCVVKIKL